MAIISGGLQGGGLWGRGEGGGNKPYVGRASEGGGPGIKLGGGGGIDPTLIQFLKLFCDIIGKNRWTVIFYEFLRTKESQYIYILRFLAKNTKESRKKIFF